MMSPLGNRLPSSKIGFSKPLPPTGPAQQTEAPRSPQDLVEITGGTTVSALKGALKNSGRFFLRHGLALAGAAIAGPVGLVVGSVASGIVAALDPSSENGSDKLKSAVKGTAISLGVGLTAGIPGLFVSSLGAVVPGALAVAGTSLSGILDFQTRQNNPDFEVKLDKLASAYHEAVGAELTKSGQSTAALGPKPKYSLTTAQAKKAQISLAKTALVASRLLGPASAVALAGDLGRKGVAAEKLTELAQQDGLGQVVSSEVIKGVEVERVKDLKRSHQTDGFALYNKVYLDEGLPISEDAKSDFVLGHELSHVKYQDSSATLIQKTLIDAVNQTRMLSGDSGERALLASLESDLELARLAESRVNELRADQDGLSYALGQGHSRESIQKAAAELFEKEPSGDSEYRQHPGSQLRLDALGSVRNP